MKAVLFVGHGSRSKQSNDQFIFFANEVGKSCSDSLFRYAFLELATPSILDEIQICVEKGANEIIVFPLLLFAAGHAKIDIPNEVAKGKKLFPSVHFHIEKPLGIQEVLISILEKRLQEKHFTKAKKNVILLVGRGSNDQEAIASFEKVAQLLRKRLQFPTLETSYLVGGHQSFEQAVQNAQRLDYDQIFILPYLLFKGVLLTKIETLVKQTNDDRFIMCQSIGADETVVELVSRKLNQVVLYKHVI